jgi:protein disulfide isomerase family A protein 3
MFGVGLLSFCLLFSVSTAQNVLDLTDASFEGELAGVETALVMFYAPWCGHCKKIKPEFEKSGGDLLRNDPPVTLAKVDCTEAGKEICNKFEVRGYPTLKIFRNGELSADYNGPREAAGITKYMKAQVGPASRKLADADAAKKQLAKEEVVIYYLGADDTDTGKAFHKLAAKMRENFAFAHSDDAGVAEALGQPLDGQVVLVRPKHLQTKLEPAQVVYTGAADKADLEAWIVGNYHGLAGHRTPDNAKDFAKTAAVVAFYGVDYVKNVKGTNYWRNRVAKVCKEFPGFKCAISNKDDFAQELTEYGFDYVGGDKPVVTARDPKGLKFKMEDEFSVDTFKTFMTLLEAGEVDPYIKSESLPDNTAANTKTAVARNFEDLVMKSSKDVLIEFYAPWCGHCKKLTPIFAELGDKMAVEDVEIVKMDATANDVPPQFNVKGFPTLYWLPKDTKVPKTYEGGREVDDFVNYIAEHATDELAGWDRKGKVKKQDL